MVPQKRIHRLLLGAAITLIVMAAGFAWTGALIPTWGATPEEVAWSLPGDERVTDPTITWTHGITIRAPAWRVYGFLAQIGDTRGGFYSYTFIENLFCAASGDPGCRYVNADQVFTEWQNPEKGAQGIIADFVLIQDYQPGVYVLAAASEEQPFEWTWLWHVEPVAGGSSRLISRHRAAFPPEAPRGLIKAVFDAGYVMERGMLLGIQARAEGNVPSPLEEPLGIVVWLAVFALGVACAVRFVRVGDGFFALGVGLAAVAALFVLTYVQPPLVWRIALLLALAAGTVIAYRQVTPPQVTLPAEKPVS